MPLPHVGTQIVDRADCMRLLASATIGRIGFTSGALPLILPVPFAMLDGDVVLRAGVGSGLEVALGRQVACFEADSFDTAQRAWWAVTVTGPTELVGKEEVLARVESLGLASWDSGSPVGRVVRLRSELVSGRWLHSRDLLGGQGRPPATPPPG